MTIWVDFKGAENQDEECKPDGLTVLMKWAIQPTSEMTDGEQTWEEVGGWR